MDRQIDTQREREKKDSKFSISNGNKFPPNKERKKGKRNKKFSKIFQKQNLSPKQNNSQHEFPVWIPA